MNRSQGDVAKRGESGVVITHERNVVRNAQTGLIDGVEGTDRRLVVAREYRGGTLLPAQQSACAFIAAALRKITRLDADVRLQSSSGHGGLVAGPSFSGARAHAAIDQSNVAVAKAHKVLHGKRSAMKIVVHHDVHPAQAQVAADHCNRHCARGGDNGFRLDSRASQDHTFGSKLEQLLECSLLSRRIAVAGGDQGAITQVGRRSIKAIEHLCEEDVVQVRNNNTNVVGSSLDKTSRDQIRAIAELLRGRHHGGPAGLADRGFAAHDSRHDRLRQSCTGGDVDDGWRSR